jgi:uncharacterized protein (TIGR03083 family)
MIDLTAMVHAERRSLLSFLEMLSDDQWQRPTWCENWNVQQVVGHLVATSCPMPARHVLGLVTSGFRFDKVAHNEALRCANGSGVEVLARFREVANDSKRIASGVPYLALGEIMVHSEDIRRGLGAPAAHRPPQHVRAIIDEYRRSGAPLHGKRRVGGLRLVATDIDWSVGEGPEARGPAMSLVMAMVGRKGALLDLGGPGVKLMGQR